MKTIDGFAPNTTARRQTTTTQSPSQPPQRIIKFAPRNYAKPKVKAKRRMPLWLQLVLISIAALAIGSLTQSALFGQLAVVAYGVGAFIWRVPSRTTFLLAVLSLMATTWMLVMQGKVELAQNFATYTFLFLVVGVLTLSRELKKEGGRIYTSRNTNTDR